MTKDEIDYEFIEQPERFKLMGEMLFGDTAISVAMRSHFGYQLNEFWYHYSFLLKDCESPIETKFLEALFAVGPTYGKPIESADWNLARTQETKEPATPALYITPQAKIKLEKEYRVDFLIITKTQFGATMRIVIECDGHDFHERTKEQAKKDKSRDRDFTSNGYFVFRFTGSEIHNDSYKCAAEVAQFACSGPRSLKK